MYYVIHTTADGDIYIDTVTKEELEKSLDCEEYGPMEFLDKIPNADTAYWGNSKMIIVKGEIVIPKINETSSKYEV